MPNQVYTLLACDPGTRSFGLSILQFTYHPNARILKNKLTFKVLENMLVQDTMKSAKQGDFNKGLVQFDAFMTEKIRKYQPDAVCGERFMNRGSLSGTASELIGYMIGTLHKIARIEGLKGFRMIGASMWKNAIKRQGIILEDWYSTLVDKSVKPRERLTPHQIDATLIGIYCAHQLVQLKGFECLPTINQFGKALQVSKVLPPEKERKKPVRKKKPRTTKGIDRGTRR
jgi:hypothetical protein